MWAHQLATKEPEVPTSSGVQKKKKKKKREKTRDLAPKAKALRCYHALQRGWHISGGWLFPGGGKVAYPWEGFDWLYRKIVKSKNGNSVFSVKDMHCR